jgi:hypothetical protein
LPPEVVAELTIQERLPKCGIGHPSCPNGSKS